MNYSPSDMSAGEPSICFVIPYFGAWPFWFPFFLQSCRRNPDVNWLFFSDCGIPPFLPANVRFVETSYADYCEFVSERLGVEFYPDNPYKLCDIKPALGHIHEEAIESYDFWAFGDIDVIYGNLRKYFTAERLQAKDLFSTHERRVSGHLCIVRNTRRMREAYRLIPKWRERFSNPEHQALDEGAFSRLFIRHKNWPESLRRFAARFNNWYVRSEFIEAHSTFTILQDGQRELPCAWFWLDGELTNSLQTGKNFPYLHFLSWKKNEWAQESEADLMGPAGLIEERGWKITASGWAPLVEAK
ncbi:hypothetical protein HG264_08890 [Pseudomonas sp. gcc21]|uniref:DUF6625 family protein n=1 Tax=Pseudomonas sp. gcc21 TaxID=2726989 RepID=UPI001451611F|nr:DUF6625 family protein [Pseudomonas sp. gcc21]QJD59014.1 hypothetical protein HG264_08890 [Pseudomonas sp. gcc21]